MAVLIQLRKDVKDIVCRLYVHASRGLIRQQKPGRVSQSDGRIQESGIDWRQEETQDEYAIVDRAGRVQIPADLLGRVSQSDGDGHPLLFAAGKHVHLAAASGGKSHRLQKPLIVTHDVALSRKVKRVVAIRDGKISSERILREKYTDRLKESTIDWRTEDTQEAATRRTFLDRATSWVTINIV